MKQVSFDLRCFFLGRFQDQYSLAFDVMDTKANRRLFADMAAAIKQSNLTLHNLNPWFGKQFQDGGHYLATLFSIQDLRFERGKHPMSAKGYKRNVEPVLIVFVRKALQSPGYTTLYFDFAADRWNAHAFGGDGLSNGFFTLSGLDSAKALSFPNGEAMAIEFLKP